MGLSHVNSNRESNTDTARRQRRYHGVYVGVVRENKDAQRMGRLKVWVDVLGSNLDDENGWVTASYCSPMAGAGDYEVAAGEGKARPENAQSSYGFWMVPPDINNTVVIMFLNGDPSRAIWIGGLFQQKTNRMVPGIPHGNTFEDGDEETVGGGPTSKERRPVTEHNRRTKQKVTEDMKRPEIDFLGGEGISGALKDQGLIRDYIRGLTDSGSRRESPSEVYGILTPGPLVEDLGRTSKAAARYGGSQFVMDDGVGREK
ncbi:MAG: phage baseplate assembly protein V, partial [Aeromonas salmonicida]